MRRRTNTSAKSDRIRPRRSLSSPSRPRLSFSDFEGFERPEKPPVPRSLWDYLQVHLQGEQPYTEEKKEHLLSLIKVPMNLEMIMAFGFLTCLDSFLYTVTIMPLKVASVLWGVVKRRSTRHVTMTNKSDIIKAVVVISTMTFLLLIDTSKLYHNIRGQNAMKLYVMFNVLEITDKLCAAWGLDVLESLFSAGTLNNYQRLATYMGLYMAYSAVHSGVLLYQIVTLNVAVNSYSNALLTLLLSNQFNEVKSTVFKRFERESLFQLTCADITERFQLWVLLVSIGLRNVVEVSNTGLVPSSWSGWNRWLGALLGPALVVLGSEVAVDWLKHSYIAKFNNFRPRVYRKFLDVLTQDYYEHAFNDQLITRRMGLPTTALACVFMRMCYQSYQILFESGESRFVKGTPTVSPQLRETLAQVDHKFVNNVSVSEIAQATRTFFSSLYNGTSPLVSFSSNIIPVWAKFDIYYVTYLLTMILVFALVFAVLVIFKLFLGLTLLRYSHSKRRRQKRTFDEMDKKRTESIKDDYLPGKTRGGQGVIELTDDMQQGLYSDGEEKKERQHKKKVVELQNVSRFDMPTSQSKRVIAAPNITTTYQYAMPSNREMLLRYEARKMEDSRYRNKHNIPCNEYHAMPNVKEKSGYYKDKQIAFWSGSFFFKVIFQSGKLRLRRYQEDNIQRPETHILTDIDVPKGFKMDSGAKVSWFYTDKLLLLKFDDFPRNGCYAIAHRLYPPEVVAHLRKTMYGFLAEQHNAAVKKYRSEVESIKKLRTEIQTGEKCNTKLHAKDGSDSGLKKLRTEIKTEKAPTKACNNAGLIEKLRTEIETAKKRDTQWLTKACSDADLIKKLRKEIDIEKQRTTKLHSDVEYLEYQRVTHQQLHEQELRDLDKKHKQDERLLKFTDFTFVCNNGKQIRAPKAVLASFWPRSEKLINSSCQEMQQKNEMTLNYSSEIVQLMLSDFYGFKIEFTKPQAFALLHLAVVYQLQELFQKVFMALGRQFKKNMSQSESVLIFKIMSLADQQEPKDFSSMLLAIKSNGKKRKREEYEAVGRNEALKALVK